MITEALAGRPVNASLVHHSDRGVQYCAQEYVELLHSHGIQISVSRAGNPYDNALAESFMRTLKQEEVYLQNYRDRDDALLHIQDFPSGVALQQSPRPLPRSFTASLSIPLLYSQQQQTVNCPHFLCLNRGVHSMIPIRRPGRNTAA